MVLFGGFIAGGVLFFVLFRGSNPLADAGSVTIWGTLPGLSMNNALEIIRKNTSGLSDVSYVEKDPRTYENDILEALAAGKGPDLIFLTDAQIVSNKDKIQFIPYTSISERTFLDTFFDAGKTIMFPQGSAGIPFSYDPLVMYWNRDMFATAGIVNPPVYWDEMLTLVPKLTKIDNSQNVLQSGLAFGASSNIDHFKDILSLLILQAGSPMTVMDASGGLTTSFTRNIDGGNDRPGEAALRFFTEFSNPIKTVYSWNPAMPESKQAFLGGDLAIYFGYASEYPELRKSNPNLNFDLAVVPQSRSAKRKTGTGVMTSFVIPKLGKNQRGAFIAANLLSQKSSIQAVIKETNLPPVRRDLLSERPSDAYRAVLYDSAIIARGWLDPNPAESRRLFGIAVDEVISGKKEPGKAIGDAETAIGNLFK